MNISSNVKKIGKNAFKNCKVTIRCKKDSAIYKYAVKNKIPYELTDVVKKGLTTSQKNIKYIVTSVKASNRTVAVTGIVNKKTASVKIPATIKIYEKTYKVTAVADKAFKNNKKLTKVTIGKNVKTIGSKAFYGCKKLTKITIQTSKLTTKSVGSKAFTGVSKKAKVYLPKKNAKAYKKLLKSKGLSTKVKYQNIK